MCAKLLLIDDDRITSKIFKDILEREGHSVITSFDGLDTMKLIGQQKSDVILLDVVLPVISGFEILRFLQYSDLSRDIPVIILTGRSSPQDVKTALDNGAHDFIRKPCEPLELIARVNSAVRIKLKQDLLNELVQMDPLTKLYNRRYFNIMIDKLVSTKNEMPNGISLVMFDCDDFKIINDTYGHIKGDDVLVAVSNVLFKSVKKTDIAARYGGEEFCLILPNTLPRHAVTVADRVRANIEKMSFSQNDASFRATISAGVSHTDCNDDKTSRHLINESDKALYAAKESGKNTVCAYWDLPDA